MKRSVASVLVGLACSGVTGKDAEAQEPTPTTFHAHTFQRTEGVNPLRGSTLVFEQSMTTQTSSVGDTPQSYVPLYELWLSFRPRYWFGSHFSLRGRFDYTKEVTNNQTTTYYRQDVFGDIWTDAVYTGDLDELWPWTQWDAGLRGIWPTSQASQAQGVYLGVGPRVGAVHQFDIRGGGAHFLNSADLELRATYLHTFSSATTPTDYGSFAYTRQDADGVSFPSDQISGQTLVSDQLILSGEAGLQVMPRLYTTLTGLVFEQWHHQPSKAPIATGTGPYAVSSAGDQQFSQSIWLIASVDFMILDELELDLGYYNLANALAPDGTQRGLFGGYNIWWSPDARVFLSAIANLDILYEDVAGHRGASSPQQAAR